MRDANFVVLAEKLSRGIHIPRDSEAAVAKSYVGEVVRSSSEFAQIAPEILEPAKEWVSMELFAALQALRVSKEAEYLA